MFKSTFGVLLFIALFPVFAYAETDSLPSRYLSLGSKKAGIGFGNAPVYTGFKFNLVNKNTRRVNIFEFYLYGESDSERVNGISIGVAGSAVQGVNGISIAAILSAAKRENGLATAFLVGADKLNGIGIAGTVACDTLNGLGISFFSLVPRGFIERRDSMVARVNGMAVSIFGSNVSDFNGVAIGVFNNADLHRGLTVGGYNYSDQHKGLAVGCYNKTRRLKGVQLGVYNVAMNNPKGFRRLPLINMHLGK